MYVLTKVSVCTRTPTVSISNQSSLDRERGQSLVRDVSGDGPIFVKITADFAEVLFELFARNLFFSFAFPTCYQTVVRMCGYI